MGGIHIIKLLLGGSPCTHWSIAQTKNRETEPSGIGWELFLNFLIALEKYQPDYFIYENNKSMAPAIREEITRRFGFEPILINSAKVSAQNRWRIYWVGKRKPDGTYSKVPIEQPEDLGILLRDVLESGVSWNEKAYTLDAHYYKTTGVFNPKKQRSYSRLMAAEQVELKDLSEKEMEYMVREVKDGKSVICGQGGGVGAKTGLYAVPCGAARRGGHERNQCWEIRSDEKSNAVIGGHQSRLVCESWDGKTHPVYEVKDGLITIKNKQYPIKLTDGYYIIRKLTVLECMRLQTVPETYIFPVSNTQAYKMLGNGWTCDVIAHLLSHVPGITEEPIEVLSMYDGMSCGHIALDKLGANVANYYATEIDKYAIKTTMENYPNTIQLGDAFQVREDGWALPVGGLIV